MHHFFVGIRLKCSERTYEEKKLVKRFDIMKGDRTTSDGTVTEGDPFDTIGERSQAYEDDAVWCPKCQTIGRIVCIGPRYPMTGPDGREAALSDDLCVCKCDPSPRLVASQETSFVEV